MNSITVSQNSATGMKENFETFIERFKSTLNGLFGDEDQRRKINVQRGISSDVLKDIMSDGPLRAFIPEEYNGRGVRIAECLSVLEASSYHSLPLSLMVGINGGLFLQPLGKYGSEEVKKKVFAEIIERQKMGGLMITEPAFGSDALHMQTEYSENGSAYHINGLKHWAGLTGKADFWLLTARKKNAKGQLTRDIDFFVHDSSNPGLEVKEVYQNLGLYMLPYGRNKIDVKVPKEYKLEPHTTGVTMMLDILHRSRLHFPGMAMGYMRRIMEEAVTHCKDRYVSGTSLFDYDQVKRRLSRIQAAFTTCSAMCTYTSEHAAVTNDLAKMDLAANSIKTVVTDMMQEISQSLLQLVGAKGYRLDHIAGRSIVDSRPFQIFEGSNDILYQQIAESVLKSMRKMKEFNLYNFLKDFEFTKQSAGYFKNTLNFEIDLQLAQRKIVDLGMALGKIISLEFILNMSHRGFNIDLINNAIEVLKSDVENIINNFKYEKQTSVVESYNTESSWYDYTRA